MENVVRLIFFYVEQQAFEYEGKAHLKMKKKHMYKFHLNIKTCWSIILRECAFAFAFYLNGEKREKVMQRYSKFF